MRDKKEKIKNFWINLLGIYILIMAILLIVFVFKLWSTTQTVQEGNAFPTNPETKIILLVLLTGALGSYIHAATSFVTYVGNRTMVTSWLWWYILRPFIGMILALIFYFVIRGGILTMDSSDSSVKSLNLFGIVAISGLVGMFSKQATDKLREIFDNFFKTEKGKGDDIRKDKVEDNILVCDRMIPLDKIIFYTIPNSQTENDITIAELYSKFKGLVTRLPIFDSGGKVKYIIHQSELSKYIAAQCFDCSQQVTQSNIHPLTLAQFLSDPAIKELVGASMAFVPKDATLEDAKNKMEETKNCRDVFITETGEQDKPVIGWLTNIDINKGLKIE